MTWSTYLDGTETCQKCNSVYEIRVTKLPARDSDYFNCEICGHQIDKWNSTESKSYRLLKKGEIQK
jgi:transcription elongation factor Elf1